MLAKMGEWVEYYSFSGGADGETCRSFTDIDGIESHYTETASGVRTNIKVIDPLGVGTELNGAGGPFTEDEKNALVAAFLKSETDVACLCGSIPQGVEKSVYKSIIKAAKAAGKYVVLDCDGEALRYGLEAKPDLIKPNLREFCEICFHFGILPENFENSVKLGENLSKTVDELGIACGKLIEISGSDVILTLGEAGACFFGRDGETVYEPPERVRANGFSGAGDTFLSVYLSSRLGRGETNADAMRLASRIAAKKVELDGTELPSFEMISEIYLKYMKKPLKGKKIP